MNQRRRATAVAFLAICAVLASWAVPHTAHAEWQGKEETIDGVLHVKNPSTPAEKPTTIELDEMWRLGGYDDDENIFGVITAVVRDDEGTLYMLDSQLTEIRVYGEGGEFLRTIGRSGEGPGEFQGPTGMFRVPDGNIGVLQSFPSKIVMLTPDGEPAGDFPIPEPEDGVGFRVLMGGRYAGDQLAMVYGINQPTQEKFTMTNRLALVAADKTEKVLHEVDSEMNFASPEIAESEWDVFRNRWASFADGRAVSALDYSKYVLHVWSPDGTLDRVIHRDYPAHKRSDDEMETMLELYKGFTRQIPIPNIQYDLDETHPPVSGGGLYTREDGSLWVLTSRGTWDREEGVVGQFDVFDGSGRFVNQVTLKGEGDPQADGYFFVGDRLYVVTDWVNALMMLQSGGGAADEEAEDEAEPMQVICYRLDGPKLGMN